MGLCISREWNQGIGNKEDRQLQSRITDENKEIMLSVLFNDPHLFGYVRNTWSLRSCKVSYRRTGHPNQFQTSSEDTKRYGH